MIVTIDIKDSVADKILYFLHNFKDDVKIIKNKTLECDLDIEPIGKDEEDYKLFMEAKKDREGIKSIDELLREYKIES